MRLRMPLRRKYEQLTVYFREAGWLEIRLQTEGRVYRRGGSGRPRNTNKSCNQKSGHFCTNNVASIDSTPLLTSFQTSSAIKRNHKETTDRSWLEEPTFDPTS
ncbi:hypothetical protein TNCV_3346721 [Trichonephila clavipes]|nr:hypothetical protein TNCV_3346721 [Trichonephila clavipes]